MAPKGAMTFSKQILSYLDRKLFFAKKSLVNLKGFWNDAFGIYSSPSQKVKKCWARYKPPC